MDLDAIERELCRIPEVTAARVVAGTDGEIEEVHILSSPSKHAKQVVRDVQSVAMATFGLDLDRRIVSVVQLDGMASSTLANAESGDDIVVEDLDPRINVESVSAIPAGLQCRAQVVLVRGEERATGVTEGLVATGSILRLVAQATVSALRQLEPAAARADVEAATVVQLGSRPVALTTIVVVVPPYEEICAGSAVVRSAGELDAVARAVLDATNRRLPQLR
ncbi:MAG TPA: hypothetical protein VF230_18355 [Acidimicrobiales bacterium]